MLKLLLIFLQLNIYSNTFESSAKEKEMVFEIDFQDFFSHDNVSLILNADTVFNNVELTSDKSMGLTSAIIKAYLYDTGKMEVFYNGKSSIVDYTENVNLLVTINSIQRRFKVNLHNGKYLGLSKKYNNDLTIVQRSTSFQYD